MKHSPVKDTAVFQSKLRQWCMPEDSGDCGIPQCCIWTPTWEWRGKRSRDNYRESEMRRWKEEGSGRGTGAGMDMNFVFKYMCLIMYVSLLLSVTVGTERRRQRERGADSLCYTKENLRERWNKWERGRLRRETPNPRCTQFGNIARCHGNAALPQSQSPHAERQRQRWEREGNNKNAFHHWNSVRKKERDLAKVKSRKVYKEGRCRRDWEDPQN